jgi:hypothetical protein
MRRRFALIVPAIVLATALLGAGGASGASVSLAANGNPGCTTTSALAVCERARTGPRELDTEGSTPKRDDNTLLLVALAIVAGAMLLVTRLPSRGGKGRGGGDDPH